MALSVADLLVAVMDRRTQELKEGKHQNPPHRRSPQRPKEIRKGLEELGHAKRLQAEWQWFAEGQRLRPGLKQLRAEDLPPGVTAARGYDHRGHCVLFAHETLGELGKIVIMNIHEGKCCYKQSYSKDKTVRNPHSSNRKSTSLSKLWQR